MFTTSRGSRSGKEWRRVVERRDGKGMRCLKEAKSIPEEELSVTIICFRAGTLSEMVEAVEPWSRSWSSGTFD